MLSGGHLKAQGLRWGWGLWKAKVMCSRKHGEMLKGEEGERAKTLFNKNKCMNHPSVPGVGLM